MHMKKMEMSTKGSEMSTGINTALESRNGRVGLSLSGNGRITKHKERDGSSIRREISMLVNLLVTRPKVKAHIFT